VIFSLEDAGAAPPGRSWATIPYAGFLTDLIVAWTGGVGLIGNVSVLVDGIVVSTVPIAGASGFAEPFLALALPVIIGQGVVFRVDVTAGTWTSIHATVAHRVALGAPTVARIFGTYPVASLAGLAPGNTETEWFDAAWGIGGLAPQPGGFVVPGGDTKVLTVAGDVFPGSNTLTNPATLYLKRSSAPLVVAGNTWSAAPGPGHDGPKTASGVWAVAKGDILIFHGTVSPVGLAGSMVGPTWCGAKLSIA
jgi:hypothetical protein